MSRLILGTEKPGPEALAQMREGGGDWYAYQSHDMSSSTLGQLQFLQCGPGRTFETPPERMPDSHLGIGWRYSLCGRVNLETGEIES